jgi:hypothetical protein
MMKVRLGLMGHDFGSRFDDSKCYLKGHSVERKKDEEGGIKVLGI